MGFAVRKAELEDGLKLKKLLANALHVLPAQENQKDPSTYMYVHIIHKFSFQM